MTENLIRQFLLEKGITEGQLDSISQLEYQEVKYKEYQGNITTVDSIEFSKWLEEKQQNSQIFRQFLLQSGFLFGKRNVTEITSDPSISCIKDLPIKLKKQILLSKPGEGLIHSGKIKLQTGILIINGVYMNQQNYLLRMSRDNSFIAGYIEGSNSKYNDYLFDYYNRLLATLHILRPLTEDYPKVQFIEQGKIHVLTRKIRDDRSERSLKILHDHKYDDDYINVSDR